MPENLFAACRIDNELVPRRVQLDGSIQDQVESIFTAQANSFFAGVDEEIQFDGRWKPDENQILTIDATPETRVFQETLNSNPNSIEPLDLANFYSVGVKALFSADSKSDDGRILVQRFTASQVLDRKFALVLAGNSFRRLTENAFALPSSLAFVIDEDVIKFKSFSNLRAILDVLEVYRAATDEDLQEFAQHPSLQVADVDDFVQASDQITRKLITGVLASGVLDAHSPAQIKEVAAGTHLSLSVEDGRIVLPAERRELKEVLQFLDESRYNGPLSGRTFVANSRRPAPTGPA